MTFDTIEPYVRDQALPKYANIPEWQQKLLGINDQGNQNTWGKILNWIPGLDIGASIADKAVANKYGKGTESYQNLNTDAKNAAVGFGTEALTAGKETLDFFTGNFGGMAKDALNLGKTIAASGSQSKIPANALLTSLGFNGNNTPTLHPFLANMAKMPANNKPIPDNGDDVYPDEEGNANTDPSATPPIVGGTVGQGVYHFRRGGLLAGSTHEEGGIALIDLLTGEDTGYRVEGGERIVNDEDYNAIKKLVKNKHHRKALALLEDIENRKPQKKEFAGGGTVPDLDVDAESQKLDEQIAEFKKKQTDKAASDGEKKAAAKKVAQLSLLKTNLDNYITQYKELKGNTAIDPKIKLQQQKQYLDSIKELSGKVDEISGNKPTNTTAATDNTKPPVNWFATAKNTTNTPVKQPAIVTATGIATSKTTPTPSVDNIHYPWDDSGIGTKALGDGDPAYKTAPTPEQLEDAKGDNKPAPDATTNAGTGNKTDIKSLIGDVGGTGFDAMRLGLGLIGATKKLKDFNVPTEFTDYENKARYFSNIGLTPEEKALANQTEQNNYGQAVNAITNASGGNAGSVLANLSRVNAGRGNYALALAAKDAELKQQNFQNFLPILNEDIGFKKEEFDRHYNQDLATKQAGAQLASDAISNIKSRFDYDKNYGSGSAYDELTKNLVAQGKSQADILKAQADFWSNPANVLGSKTYSPYNYDAHLPASTTTG